MALPQPFNTVGDLILWSGFDQGAPKGQESVKQGTFAYSQFETALNEARREIYRKTGGLDNGDFDDARADELREAERYLATARLFPNFGARMQISFPESNLAGIGSISIGADTPSPLEKGRQYVEFMTDRFRAYGLELLKGYRWGFRVFEVGADDTPFPYETHYPR